LNKKTKTLMVVGTSSSAGKSLLVTGLCHYFARKGVSVAPFKAQNMSNNAAVCPGGGEIGRAQAVQALAAGLKPSVVMNPVLIKPESDGQAQVIVNGKPWKSLTAGDYYDQRKMLWKEITQSLDSLRDEYELVIIEGAGSPVEMNLKKNDLVNMKVAEYADAPTLIVGDIDRGGIFSQLLGTYWLLSRSEQELIKGFVVNKFRGIIELFTDGIEIIEEKSGIPVLGVIPYLYDLNIPEEDSVALENLPVQLRTAKDQLVIGVVNLPRISNFDDFDPLDQEDGVRLVYFRNPEQIADLDALILPGTKSTLADLDWLDRTGFSKAIQDFAENGGNVVGICGGYQLLGERIENEGGLESSLGSRNGLGLMPVVTRFLPEKTTSLVSVQVMGNVSWLRDIAGSLLEGYEIHMGQSTSENSWLTIKTDDSGREGMEDGCITADGRIWGCYLHGIFENQSVRRAWLRNLGWVGQDNQSMQESPFQKSLLDLSHALERSLDLGYLEEIIWGK